MLNNTNNYIIFHTFILCTIICIPLQSRYGHIIMVLVQYTEHRTGEKFQFPTARRSRRTKCAKMIQRKQCTRPIEYCTLLFYIYTAVIYICGCMNGARSVSASCGEERQQITIIIIHVIYLYIYCTHILASSSDGIGSLARLLNRFSRGQRVLSFARARFSGTPPSPYPSATPLSKEVEVEEEE